MTDTNLMNGISTPIKRHFALCKTGLHHAPAALGNRKNAARWARQSVRLWIVLVAVGLAAGWLVPALASLLVDTFYSLGDQSLSRTLTGLFDGSTAKLAKLRAARHDQFLWVGYVALSAYGLSEVLRSFAAFANPPSESTSGAENSFVELEATQVIARNAAVEIESTNDVTQVLPQTTQSGQTAPKGFSGDRYRVESVLGTGGAGRVVKAFDSRLHRAVAIKQLLVNDVSEDDFVGRFEQEARTLANLSHPHIVAVHDYVVEGGQLWIVMELLTGGHLKGWIRQRHPSLRQAALAITRDIASALAYAHERQIVHRDIKPENILRSADGVWKLTDFGIAKQHDSNIKTEFGLVIGSVSYMSPEQAAGASVDARSDIYSLGISLYEMLAGELPFRGDTREVLAQQMTRSLPAIESVPPAVNELLQRMTAKAPEARFADCRELIRAIDNCQLD